MSVDVEDPHFFTLDMEEEEDEDAFCNTVGHTDEPPDDMRDADLGSRRKASAPAPSVAGWIEAVYL